LASLFFNRSLKSATIALVFPQQLAQTIVNAWVT
jgi:hypothetical protein